MICAPPWQGRVEMTRGLMRRYRAMRQPWRGYRPTLVATIGETWCASAENRCGSFGNVGVIRPEVLARVHQQQKTRARRRAMRGGWQEPSDLAGRYGVTGVSRIDAARPLLIPIARI